MLCCISIIVVGWYTLKFPLVFSWWHFFSLMETALRDLGHILVRLQIWPFLLEFRTSPPFIRPDLRHHHPWCPSLSTRTHIQCPSMNIISFVFQRVQHDVSGEINARHSGPWIREARSTKTPKRCRCTIPRRGPGTRTLYVQSPALMTSLPGYPHLNATI